MSEPKPIADVRGKAALVIGSTRGIGHAIAERFASSGARVGVTGRVLTAAREAASEIGADALAFELDVDDRPAIEQVVRRFAEECGRADALVYCAGVSPAFTSADKLDDETWDAILSINVSGAFAAARSFARVAIERARPCSIVFLGSTAGIAGAGRLAAYSASKAALIGLTKSLALDWARYGIRVNVLAPGWVETDMTAGVRKSESLSKMILARTPQGRMAAPKEIADLAVFLASESASFATGGVFTLDGGWTSG